MRQRAQEELGGRRDQRHRAARGSRPRCCSSAESRANSLREKTNQILASSQEEVERMRASARELHAEAEAALNAAKEEAAKSNADAHARGRELLAEARAQRSSAEEVLARLQEAERKAHSEAKVDPVGRHRRRRSAAGRGGRLRRIAGDP